MPRLPPLNPLRAFEAVARTGSVTSAAHELSVTHGAVSHQVRALEDALGVALFVRGARPPRLTPQGATLIPAVSNAFRDIAAATARLQRPAARGTLTISCVPGFLSFWMIPRLGDFSAQHPDITLTIQPSNSEEKLADSQVDICILYGHGNWPGYWVQLLSQIEFFPVASPELMRRRPLGSPRELRHHTILHGDLGREWNTWLAAAGPGLHLDGPQHFLSDARLSTEAALRGHGIALGDSVTASDFIARGELIAPFGLSVRANSAFYLACRRGSEEAPMIRTFLDWIRMAVPV